jgi:hypothetical protein
MGKNSCQTKEECSFLKKEPKNFYMLARALRLARASMIKSFLLLFFKKKALLQ